MRNSGDLSVQNVVKVRNQHFTAELCKSIVQFAGRFVRSNRKLLCNEHRPAIQSGRHRHQTNARCFVTRQNRCLYRRRASPPWQYGRMHIETTPRWNIQYVLWKYQSVRCNDDYIRLECLKCVRDLITAKGDRLQYRNTLLLGVAFHGARGHTLAASSRSVWLSQDCEGIDASIDERR